jgi:formylglycine-generating enzyme required for sulfatase activity
VTHPTPPSCTPLACLRVRTNSTRSALLHALVALLPILHTSAQPQPTVNTPGLAAVLDVQRLPDKDLILLRTGDRLGGQLANPAFLLQTPETNLTFPTATIAAIDLTDHRTALTSIITVNGNRFTGFLANAPFVLQIDPSGPDSTIHPHQVLKVILRHQPQPPSLKSGNTLAQLHNGDFFTGQLLDPRFLAEDGRTDWTWPGGADAILTFPQISSEGALLELTPGDLQRLTLNQTHLEFDLDLGFRLHIPIARIARLVTPPSLSTELPLRLGMVPSTSPPDSTPSPLPDPGIVPVGGMVWIAPGEFTMGSPPDEAGRDLDEGPLTHVILAAGFWLGRFEVTQVDYESLMGTNPSRHQGNGLLPVERVSWQEAVSYCQKLTERERIAGRITPSYAYRLPTEAEWEYACRAGTTTRYSFGDDPSHTLITDYAWININSASSSHPVGSLLPNPWGLHDLHGNVCEWVLDPWQASLPGDTVTHAVPVPQGTLRIARGGSWLYEPRFSRSANRDSYGLHNRCSDVGFRIALARIPETAADPSNQPTQALTGPDLREVRPAAAAGSH